MSNPSNNTADLSLQRIIARVESNGNYHAYRFEPAIFGGLSQDVQNEGLVEKIATINSCSHDSARVIFSSSYGVFQLMGFNIYTLGFCNNVFDFWASTLTQAQIFSAFLTHNSINVSWDSLKRNPDALAHFAEVYNGPGGRVTYADAMRNAARSLGL